MHNNDQEFLVQKIRTQYTEKEHTNLDELKKLDSKVKRPANLFAYLFGSIGALIMGSGMSLILTQLYESMDMSRTASMAVGILLGIAGIVLVCAAYPLYNRTLRRQREKVAPEILRLTEELMQ